MKDKDLAEMFGHVWLIKIEGIIYHTYTINLPRGGQAKFHWSWEAEEFLKTVMKDKDSFAYY